MAVAGAHKIEALYKNAAGLRLSKEKVKEISDVIDKKLYDFLLTGEANAKYNSRDIIWYSDLPLTKAFRESMRKFLELEEKLALQDVLDNMKSLPPMFAVEVELENKLADIAGTLVYILAKITRELSPNDSVVSADEMKRAERILNLMI